MRKLAGILLSFIPLFLSGQQNHTLYSMPYVAESNFLNPAIQSECKWFIGLPLLSSIHLNYGNSGFSYHSFINPVSPGTVELQVDEVVDQMGRRTFIGTEFHTNLLALGYKHKEYYFNFSVLEKLNLPLTFSRELFQLPWGGNTQFVDETAGSKGTAIYAVHYREYALGVSKHFHYGNFWGIKAKLLFGKAYLGTPRMDVSLFTDSTTYNLTLTGDIAVNMSAPVVVSVQNGDPRSLSFAIVEDLTVYQYLFNRRNWGIALDGGFIRQLNSRTSVSGSIIDLGFLGWRSNPANLSVDEAFTYEGILADSMNIIAALTDSIELQSSNNTFYTMLPLKLYLGGSYALNEKLSAGALGSAVIYKTKLLTALTLSLDYNPFRNFHLIGSYSLMYRSFNNVGLGISIGRGPLQFYAISDNVAGMIWPLSTRNLNLRFGLNINLGCKKNEKENVPSDLRSPVYMDCPAYMSPLDRVKRR